jgi:hypothetical protein
MEAALAAPWTETLAIPDEVAKFDGLFKIESRKRGEDWP